MTGYPYVPNLAVWSTNSAGTYGTGDNKPSLTAPPIIWFDASHTFGGAGYNGGDYEYGDSSFVSYADLVTAPTMPPFISATTIYSTQVTAYGTMVDGFAAPRSSLTGGELGTIARAAPGSGSPYTGQAVFPVAANDSGQFVTEINSDYVLFTNVPPYNSLSYQSQAISYSAGGPTGRLTLPAGLTPRGGLGKISNVNALGTFYVLGSDRTLVMTNYPAFTPPTKYECWDGTNTITLPQLSTNLPPSIIPTGVNALTATVTLTNGAPQTNAATQVIGNGGGYGYIWELNPPSTNAPSFGNPQQLDSLVAQPPGSPGATTNISNITAASINDSGCIVGTAQFTTFPYAPVTHGVLLIPDTIQRDGMPINSTNNTVAIGQQINLTNMISGVPTNAITYWSWSIPGANGNTNTDTAIYDYEPSVSNSNYTNLVTPTNHLTNSSGIPFCNFYWTAGGTNQVSCTTVIYGQTNTVTATINVLKPKGQISVTKGPIGVGTDYNGNTDPTKAWLYCGKNVVVSGVTNAGILFGQNITEPTGYSGGSNIWVQVINAVTVSRTSTISGSSTATNVEGTSGVDNRASTYVFHFIAGTSGTSDSPSAKLLTTNTVVSESFNATMNLMWQPPTNSVGGDKVIFVPLRNVPWNWSGTATNSSPTNNGSGWGLQTNFYPSSTNDYDATNEPNWTQHAQESWHPGPGP